MDEPTKKPKRRKRKGRADMKVGEIKQRKAKSGITKKEFLAILDKASQPIKREAESDSKSSGT